MKSQNHRPSSALVAILFTVGLVAMGIPGTASASSFPLKSANVDGRGDIRAHASVSMSPVGNEVTAVRQSSSTAVVRHEAKARHPIRDVACTANKWVGFTAGNKDINAVYDGSTDPSGPNGCEISDADITIPDVSLSVPASVTVPVGTNAVTEGNLTVATGGTLTISGTLDLTTNNDDLSIDGTVNVTANASLFMSGTIWVESGGKLSGSSGTITGPSHGAVPGSWNGIDYEPGSTGVLTGMTIKFGGSGLTSNGGGYVTTNVAIEGSASVSISGSHVDNSNGDGVTVLENANPSLTSTSFTYCKNCGYSPNGGSAVSYETVPGNLSGKLSTLTSSGYGFDAISLGGGDFTTVGTWPSVGLPYHMTDNIDLTGPSSLSLPAGDTFWMEPSTSLVAKDTSSLILAGTQPNPVTFESSTVRPGSGQATGPGQWGMIDYQAQSGGSISYGVIKDGGDGENGASSYISASIAIETSHSVAVTNSQIIDPGQNGIEVTNDSNPSLINDAFSYCTSCNYSDNSGDPVEYDFLPKNLTTGSPATPLLSGLTSGGFQYNDVYVNPNGATLKVTAIWPAPGLDYYLNGDSIVGQGGNLTLAAGDIFLVTGTIFVYNGGKLTIAGSSTASVTLTSYNDYHGSPNAPHPGDWGGIDSQDGGSLTMTYGIVKYAGDGFQGSKQYLTTDVALEGTHPYSITNSSIVSSVGDDLDITGGATPVLTQDDFGGGAGSGVGINNLSAGAKPVINAAQNFWENPTGPKVSTNPTGKGTRLGTGVTYSPWLSSIDSESSRSSQIPASAVILKSTYGQAGSIGFQATGGTGGVVIDQLSGSPATVPVAGAPATFFQASIAAGSAFAAATLLDCNAGGGQIMWLNGSTWSAATQSAPNANGCVSVTFGTSTAPSLASLSNSAGVLFTSLVPTQLGLASASTAGKSTYGQSVTLTATVTAASGSAAGSVEFLDGTTSLGVVPVATGKAQLQTSKLGAGVHHLSAAFTASSASGFGNSATATQVTQTVAKAPLKITATKEKATYGAKMPVLAWTAAAFVNSETASALTTQPVCKSTAKTASGNEASAAGTYPITCSGAVSPNYAISYLSGKLTVSAAPVVLAYTGPVSLSHGKKVSLSATIKTSKKAPIKGRKLTITLGSGNKALHCTTTASLASGAAACSLTAPATKGKSTVTVAFAGDPKGAADFYAKGKKTATVTIK